LLPLSFGKTLRIAGSRTAAVLAICVLTTLAITLTVAQKVMDHEKTAALDAHARRVLEHAGHVAEQSASILRKALQLDTVPCSTEDLEQLRVLSFESRFVRDVMRLEGATVACSAAWGRMKQPFSLPVAHHGIAPYRFWRDVNTSPVGHVRADITAHGAVAVVTAPGAFDDAGLSDPHIKTLVTSRDGRYVFRSFGGAEFLASGHAATTGGYVVSHCHAQRLICVVESSPQMWLWSVSWPLLVALTGLGTLAGAGVGITVNSLVRRRAAMGTQLQRAIEHGAIRVVYQPIRMLKNRRLVGVEALARWTDATGQNIPPDQFIPLAEELGLLDALTRSVLRTTFSELGERLRSDEPFYVSVNVNSEEIISGQFRRYLHGLCLEHRIPASRVALEVTERSTANYADLTAAFQEMRDAGHRVMIDDFGTGYSNFAYLAALPLDAIKMDRAFTRAIGTESLASAVIPGIVSIATAMRVTLIVEGIETEAQEQYLRALHPEARGQGWLLGRPATVRELPAH